MQNPWIRLLWWATCTFQIATGSREPAPIPSTVFGWMSSQQKRVEDSGGNEHMACLKIRGLKIQQFPTTVFEPFGEISKFLILKHNNKNI